MRMAGLPADKPHCHVEQGPNRPLARRSIRMDPRSCADTAKSCRARTADRTKKAKRACSLLDLEIYRGLLTAVALNLILNGLPFVERH